MSEQDDIQKRDQQIAEIDRLLAEAKLSLDMTGWARENGIDLDRVMASVKRRCSASEYDQAKRQAEDDFNAMQRDLAQTRLPDALSDHPAGAPRRVPRAMV